ncbi:hypothetical protein K466DRAFT_280081 [Polyporus arcularius HHB13444]|uniref:Uncharacterized protein n=1 Tax=Polyporus arcularius HHB13444 TaxID=1314778 RepID=A0A5C3PAU2_9APHY|nr:hypothetical protein K466DRAFT_280081 [Polyporus arcularius HHB13444]
MIMRSVRSQVSSYKQRGGVHHVEGTWTLEGRTIGTMFDRWSLVVSRTGEGATWGDRCEMANNACGVLGDGYGRAVGWEDGCKKSCASGRGCRSESHRSSSLARSVRSARAAHQSRLPCLPFGGDMVGSGSGVPVTTDLFAESSPADRVLLCSSCVQVSIASAQQRRAQRDTNKASHFVCGG